MAKKKVFKGKKSVRPTESTLQKSGGVGTMESDSTLLWGKQNYILMIVGIGLVLGGMLLMIGGGSEDPNVFNSEEIYSFRRITLAPIIILVGLCIEVYAIFKAK